ncbi:MAG: ATPase, T2SS/T4P/T4SS family [Woeseiaceae bacterium]
MTMPSLYALREAQPNVSLVERLIAAGVISEHQLERALQEKRREDRPLGEILVELGLISDKVLRGTLPQLFGEGIVDLREILPNPHAVAQVPRELAERYSVLPIDYDPMAELLTLAVTESFDLAAVDDLSPTLGAETGIATLIAAEVDVKSAIRRLYDFPLSIPKILSEIDVDESGILNAAHDLELHSNPLNRLINAIFFDAAQRSASAIHFEPEAGFLRVRYRIDGVLSQVMALHRSYWPGMNTRLNAMLSANSDPDVCANEGRFSVVLGTRRSSLTLFRQATQHGDHFVVRIAAEDQDAMPLEQLGLNTDALAKLRLMMARPDGLLIVAGPAGSGKTSTVCSLLRYRSDESVCITALDEGLTYAIPLVRQASFETADRRDQADRILELMGRDSDVLMIGELVDQPSAIMALRAVVSGRQVYTTLQARSAFAALPRLLDMGVQPQSLAGNISGIIAQRLLRKLCRHCRQPYAPEPNERKLLGIDDSRPLRLYREGACEHCDFLGYKGRQGIFEVVIIDREFDELLARGASIDELQQAYTVAGLRDLAGEAMRQVLAGVTSLSEASRVVDFSVRLEQP